GIAMEETAHHPSPAGIGQELAVIADEPARGHVEDHARLGPAGGTHVGELAAAQAQLLDHDPSEFVVDVDLHLLDRLQALACLGIPAQDDARATDRQLEAFAAHRLDEHAQLQLAAPGHFIGVLALALADVNRDIAFRLALEPGADHAARHFVAL